jgi:glycosyltransferase involved in cell wall biosynthesis
MKALQYMALGIPPVVSPVGVNATIIRDAVNGFYARTEEEWIDRIALILEDEALRLSLGQEARKTVEESYSARVHAPRVARILAEAAARRFSSSL